MTRKLILIIFAGLFISVGIYIAQFKLKSKQSQIFPDKPFGETRMNAEQIVDSLQKLGYFKYAAINDIDTLKKEIVSGLNRYKFLSTLYEENKPYNSKDYRNHNLDGEDLFEEGGFIDKLNEMQLTFSKMNIKMIVNKNIEEWDDKNEWLNHIIILNDKKYTLFKNFKGYGWGEAAQRFADIINDQLALQGSDERIFLANGGNDGSAVFLTEKQFTLLDPYLEGKNDRPLRIEDWCKVMQVERVKMSEK
jgi:hypothetical protein